jgi:xanthine dehydrogenase YagR molybdenum-binding subunit
MVQTRHERVIGQPLSRLDGPKKVTGTAPYAFEHALKEVAYGFPVQSTIAKGQVASIDTRAAQAIEGVLTILTHENTPRLASQSDADLAVLHADVVAYRG